jgi:hypothetical protein
MSWNGIISTEQSYVMTLVSYITVKTNNIRPIPSTSESSEKAIAMFKHALSSIVARQALRAYNIMYRGDSLRIKVVDSGDKSINHRHGLMIAFDEGRQSCIVHLDTRQGGSATLDVGERRYIHPQFLLRLGNTRDHNTGKEPKLPSSFQAVIVTDPFQNVVHYQTVTIFKHIHESLRMSFSDWGKMPISATQTFIEAIEMQECIGTDIQDDIHHYSKDDVFAKVDCPTPIHQPNHTYPQTTIDHDQTKHDNSTQQHPYGNDTFGQCLQDFDWDQSCAKATVTWIDHVNELPNKTSQSCSCTSPNDSCGEQHSCGTVHRNTLLVDNVNNPYKLLLSFPFRTKGNIIPNAGKRLNELGSGDSNIINITEDSFMNNMNGVQLSITNVDLASILPGQYISNNVMTLILKW